MASIYKEEEKLEASAQGGGMRMWSSMMAAAVPIIKNVKDKQYSNDKEYMEKNLIKDSLTSLVGRWKLKQE
jgi:hypothetical protein